MTEIPPHNKDQRVIALSVGLPGSGKTTWAKELVYSDPSRWKRINRDDVRLMLHAGYHDYTNRDHEQAVTEICNASLRAMLSAGHDCIVDNTHLASRDRKGIHDIAEEFGALVIEKAFEVPLEECLRRNALREGVARVPEEIIREKAKKFGVNKHGKFANLSDKVFDYSLKNVKSYTGDPLLPWTIIVDLDGTLCLHNGRNPYDAARCEEDLVNHSVLEVIHRFYESHEIIFMSGRSDKYRPETEKWLEKHVGLEGIYEYSLHMRTEGDQRKDSIVKRELFDQHIRDRFNVRFILDDRDQVVSMYRKELGLPVFQVNYGNF